MSNVVYCIMICEEHVGDFLCKIFTTREKAEAYLKVMPKNGYDDYVIEEWEID